LVLRQNFISFLSFRSSKIQMVSRLPSAYQACYVKLQVCRPEIKGGSWGEVPPWQQFCPSEFFCIVILLYLVYFALPKMLVYPPSPLKYICPTMVCFLVEALQVGENEPFHLVKLQVFLL